MKSLCEPYFSKYVQAILVEVSDEEILSHTLSFIEIRIEDPPDSAYRFGSVLEVLRKCGKTFDDVYAEAQQDVCVLPWIATAKAQFQEKRGSIDEINPNLHAAVGDTGTLKFSMRNMRPTCK